MARGLQFSAVDLHVHTPASKCFRDTVTPDEYVKYALDAGVSAIAITDHNTGDWIDSIKEAATGTPLTVFPGVEISVAPGVHIVAIFPEDRTSAHVNDLLARLRLGADARGRQEALVTEFGPQKVISMIRDEGALPVLAHIDDHKGVWQELSGQTREQLWQAAEFAAVEIVGEQLPAEIGTGSYTYVPAYYWSSDNPHPDDPTKHSHLGIGQRCSLFKLDKPITWEGLRLCLHDPAVRIGPRMVSAPIQLQRQGHPQLKRVQIEGGFLDGLDLKLNPNLNCIIGGRGTGKSTLLELVRYAFDIEVKTEANRSQSESIIAHTFPAGSCIKIDFYAGDTSYRIERTAERPPRVYRDGSPHPLDVAPQQLLPIQVYGQKEIYQISLDPQFQLRLLDNYVEEVIRNLRDREDQISTNLKANADEILRQNDEIDSADEKLQRIGAIREELRRMEQKEFVGSLQDKQYSEREMRLLARAEQEVEKLIESVKSFLVDRRPDSGIFSDEVVTELPNVEVLNYHKKLLERIDAELGTTLETLIKRIEHIWSEGHERRIFWQQVYDEQDEIYQTLLREFQTEGEQLDPQRYVKLQKQLASLVELQEQTEVMRQNVAKLYETRHNLLDQLRVVRRHQYEVRYRKAEELTEALNSTVRITVHPEGNRQAYAEYLDDLFRGQNVWRTVQESLVEVPAPEAERAAQRPVEVDGETRYLIPGIPRYLDPIDLATAIRAQWDEDDKLHNDLETRWGVTSSKMRRNLAEITENKLFELQTYRVPDLPVIELQVRRGLLGYRPLSSLSVGQKCTALLGIVLLESSATLLVDQPEDDLDNQFIFDQIVETLRHEKEQRQFLIATHNANIPVSGDAELIIVVNADQKKGWVIEDGIGSIDSPTIKHAVERILEGGQRAFQIRREKYGIE